MPQKYINISKVKQWILGELENEATARGLSKEIVAAEIVKDAIAHPEKYEGRLKKFHERSSEESTGEMNIPVPDQAFKDSVKKRAKQTNRRTMTREVCFILEMYFENHSQ